MIMYDLSALKEPVKKYVHDVKKNLRALIGQDEFAI